MNVLVTGGAGFIGSHTVDALIGDGDRVRVLDCLDPQIHGGGKAFPAYMHPRAERIRGDVRKLDDVAAALDGVDVVYHFAAQTGVGQSMYALRSYVDANCTGTAALLEAMLNRPKPMPRLVLASSRAVYGEGAYRCPVHGSVSPGLRPRPRLEAGEFSPLCPICHGAVEPVPTPESSPLVPVSMYGWTKLQQEQLCRHVSDTLGLELVILRYFNVIGSRQSLGNPYTGILTVFYKRIMSGRPIQLYEAGKPIRDFIHIRDIVAANLLARRAPLPARSIEINVGTGRPATIRELAGCIARVCSRPAAMEETGQFRVGDIYACVADLSRARSILGYEPATDMEAGVREFVDWAQQQDAADDAEQAEAELERHGLLGRGPSRG